MKNAFGQKTATLIFFIAILGLLLFSAIALLGISHQSGEREANALAQVIKEGLLQCYALEGGYPESLDYLIENYGLILNTDHYYFYYEPYGANIFPTVKVFKK